VIADAIDSVAAASVFNIRMIFPFLAGSLWRGIRYEVRLENNHVTGKWFPKGRSEGALQYVAGRRERET